MTRSRGLVYTDRGDSSINLVLGTQIETLITLRGWRPRSLCNTSTGDLLVIMNSDDFQQTKVVRYSGSTQKQTIQWDNRGKPLPTKHETFLKRFEKVSKRFLVKKRCINVFKMFSQKFHET